MPAPCVQPLFPASYLPCILFSIHTISIHTIHSYIHSYIHLFMHTYIHSFTHTIHSFIPFLYIPVIIYQLSRPRLASSLPSRFPLTSFTLHPSLACPSLTSFFAQLNTLKVPSFSLYPLTLTDNFFIWIYLRFSISALKRTETDLTRNFICPS